VDIVTEKFIEKLTTALNHIDDENTIYALVSILVVMCAAAEKKIQKESLYLAKGEGENGETTSVKTVNYAFVEFMSNEHYYREKILFLTNRGKSYRMDKCLETINIILSKEESK
jgi:hypothetical protein